MVSSYGGNRSWENAQQTAFNDVQNQFGGLPYDCQDLDNKMKKIDEAIQKHYSKKNPSNSLYEKAYIEQLQSKKSIFTSSFSSNGCRDIFENIRLKTNLVGQTQKAITAETNILGENNKEQNIYIGVGGVVLLVGLFIILNK